MREIRFRGKRVDNGQWIYGYLCFVYVDVNKARIYDPISVSSHDVLLETVGQYTGLKDKNGKEIYEGDVVSDGSFNFEVYQHDSGQWRAGRYCLWEYVSDDETENCWKIISNTYDNPELLKSY